MFSILKGQLNSLNCIILIAVVGMVLFWLNKRKVARLMVGLALVFYYLISTNYLPRYYARQLERKYMPVKQFFSFAENRLTIIHLLGGSYTVDVQLAALSQLSQECRGRLIEAIRLLQCMQDAILVCSGNTVIGNKNMKEIYREATISLRIDSLRTIILKNPSSTQEGAEKVVSTFGKDINLVVVTSALHMHRAMTYFRSLGGTFSSLQITW